VDAKKIGRHLKFHIFETVSLFFDGMGNHSFPHKGLLCSDFNFEAMLTKSTCEMTQLVMS
jgi:hypothetical protein